MPHTIGQFLVESSSLLKAAGIATGRLDSLVLMEDVLGVDRSRLLANQELIINQNDYTRLSKMLKCRLNHEPLAYIRGKTEFYGREFLVNHSVLEPRPETETMIDLAKAISPAKKQLTVADIGCGSGCIGITMKLELPNLRVVLTDIDKDCLATARRNAAKLMGHVEFLAGNMLEPVINSSLLPTIIMANLPYVPDHFSLNQAAANEPRLAIFGGSDGLDLYRLLFDQTKMLPKKPAFMLTESLPPQHIYLSDIAANAGYKLLQEQDFIQLFGA